jgi:hypothetical protein
VAPGGQVLAWPRPESPRRRRCRPPARGPTSSSRSAAHAKGPNSTACAAWRRGDTLRQVVWKKVARSGELVSRDTAGSGRHELQLDWHAARGPDAETRLSRLAAWVLAADRSGHAYGLQLPGVTLPPASGEASAAARWMRWPCGKPDVTIVDTWHRLPRDARDTLFQLILIGWTVLPHLRPPAALWCSLMVLVPAVAGPAGAARGAAAAALEAVALVLALAVA